MYKSLEVKKSALHKISNGFGELKKTDIEGTLKSLTPGEWVIVKDVTGKKLYIAFANPLVADKTPAIKVLKRLIAPPKIDEAEN